jgi:hypothetical protein
LKLYSLPKRSGVEKLLPRTEYIFERPHGILVHLVGYFPKAIVEVTNGPASRFQSGRGCVPIKLFDACGPFLSFFRQLATFLSASFGSTHNNLPPSRTSAVQLNQHKKKEATKLRRKEGKLGDNAPPCLKNGLSGAYCFSTSIPPWLVGPTPATHGDVSTRCRALSKLLSASRLGPLSANLWLCRERGERTRSANSVVKERN